MEIYKPVDLPQRWFGSLKKQTFTLNLLETDW